MVPRMFMTMGSRLLPVLPAGRRTDTTSTLPLLQSQDSVSLSHRNQPKVYVPSLRFAGALPAPRPNPPSLQWVRPAEAPLKIYSINDQVGTATVVSNLNTTPKTLGGSDDNFHVVLKIPRFKFLEGQDLGILTPVPPGVVVPEEERKKIKTLGGQEYFSPRLYSIASPAFGEAGDGESVALIVKRVVKDGPTIPGEPQSVYGICSNYLANLKAGDTVKVIGPTAKEMLMPDPTTPVVMISNGTGIAPFRGIIHARFGDDKATPAGDTWLFTGYKTSADALYQDDFEAVAKAHPEFHLVTAISREMQNSTGGRMYVQHQFLAHGAAMVDKLNDGKTVFMLCGGKDMANGILEAIDKLIQDHSTRFPPGTTAKSLVADLKKQKRWRTSVY